MVRKKYNGRAALLVTIMGWNGTGLTCTSVTIPMIHSYWVDPVQNTQDHFDVSPDGRHVAFEEQNVLESNIGMLQNIR